MRVRTGPSDPWSYDVITPARPLAPLGNRALTAGLTGGER
jgi:hypothetical protein